MFCYMKAPGLSAWIANQFVGLEYDFLLCASSYPCSLWTQGYGVGKLKYVILNSCTNVSSEALGHLLKACSSIRVVEINGCMQLREVVALHPQVEWVSKPLESKRPSSVGRLSVDNKVKTLKIVGRKRQNSSRGLEDQSGYSLDESGSRDKSTGEEESTDADPMMIDSLDSTEKDMANRVEHSLTRELKRVKVGSVRKVVRTVLPNGCNNYKTQELTNGAEEGLHVKKKGDIDPVNCKMKALHNMTSNFKASSTHLSVTEKSTSPSCKVEFLGKGISLSPKVAEKELEKELTAALKAVMDADIDHVFFHAVSIHIVVQHGACSCVAYYDGAYYSCHTVNASVSLNCLLLQDSSWPTWANLTWSHDLQQLTSGPNMLPTLCRSMGRSQIAGTYCQGLDKWISLQSRGD
jgi:hypothetical protein